MSWCCLIGASPSGSRALTAAGWDIAVLAPAGSLDEDVFAAARLSIPVDLSHSSVRAGMATATNALGQPGLIVSFTELGQQIAADLSAEAGLPGADPEVVARTRDKAAMRHALRSTRLAWPFVAGTTAEVRDGLAGRIDEGPWVAKPADGFASRHITVIEDRETLERWSAAAQRLDEQRAGAWIAEALAGGPEFSVETVSGAGRHRVLAVTAKTTSGPPHFVEVGHVVPAPLSGEDHDRICSAATDLLDALGVTTGAGHTEIRLDPRHGPVVIETHTRPGGDCIPELVLLATGWDQYDCAVSSVLGERVSSSRRAVAPAAAIRFMAADRTGELTAITGPGVAGRPNHILRSSVTAAVGDRVTAPTESEHRLGYVIALGQDPTAALTSARGAAAGWRFQVEP